MAALLAECDLAIGAGGTATWERLALGVPTLALSLAENQSVLLNSLAQAGVVCAPDLAAPEPEMLALHLQALLENQRLRHHLSAAGMALVDGNGASRVAAVAAVATVTLRRATAADSARLLSWRNQELVRLASLDPRLIAGDEHQRWLAAVLRSQSRHLLIGEANGRAVGVVRLDVDGGRALVSIYLAPEQHGKGNGATLLLAAEHWLRRQIPAVNQLVAEVRAGNTHSLSLFERCGYQQSTISFSKRLSA
jgi:RimJ/RimL family protein N-acetyltransferase